MNCGCLIASAINHWGTQREDEHISWQYFYCPLKRSCLCPTDGDIARNALQKSQLYRMMMMIVGEVKYGSNSKLSLVESQCLQSPQSKSKTQIVTPKIHCRKANSHNGFPQGTKVSTKHVSLSSVCTSVHLR